MEEYVDLVFDFVVKIVGLSYCSSHEDKLSKTNLVYIIYSSILVILFTAGSLYFPSTSFSDINNHYDRLVLIIYFFSNLFLLYITYFTHMLNERAYWKIRCDIENIADYRLSRKRVAYFRANFTFALVIITYAYWIYPFFTKSECPKTLIDLYAEIIRYLPGYYGTIASFKTALLYCRIERQYVIMNDSYKYFNADTYFISEYKLVIGSEETIEEIRLRLFKKYKETHLALGEIVKSVNIHFTFALLVDIIRAFIVVYFGIYWVILVSYEKGFKSLQWRFLSIFEQVAKVIVLSSACSGIEYEFNRSKRKLDAILDGLVGEQMQEEATSLIDKLQGEVCANAGGMFQINYTMLLEMGGALITNLVVIIQLRFPDLLKNE